MREWVFLGPYTQFPIFYYLQSELKTITNCDKFVSFLSLLWPLLWCSVVINQKKINFYLLNTYSLLLIYILTYLLIPSNKEMLLNAEREILQNYT